MVNWLLVKITIVYRYYKPHYKHHLRARFQTYYIVMSSQRDIQPHTSCAILARIHVPNTIRLLYARLFLCVCELPVN